MAVRGAVSHQAIRYKPAPFRFHAGWLSASILCPLTHAYQHHWQVHQRKILQNFLLLRLFAFFAHNLGVKRALSVY